VGSTLKIKAGKCRLFASKVTFLGHLVNAASASVNPKKTAAIDAWPVPASISDLRTYLGLCSYYHRYVEGYATIAASLNELLRKGEPWR